MVGRSLHRQGILACYCPTSTTGRPAHLSPRAWPAQDHGPCSSEPPANLLTHLFAKLLLAGGSFIFGNIEPIEDVEFFKDRVTIARHRRNAQQFGRRRARAGDLLSAYRVGAIAEREAAQLRHVCRGEGSADRSTEIHAKLFQFGPVIGQNQAGIPRAGPGVPAAENSSLPAGRQDLPRRDLRHRVLLGLSISRHSGAGGLSGGFRFRGRRSARDLLRGRIQLGKGLSRLVDERSVCQHRRARRNNGRQAGIDHNALGPSVSRFNADDGFVYRRVPNEALRGIGQVPVRHEQHRK
jgi:hypothetical protein